MLISLGTLVNVHATRGELRMLPFNPGTETLHPGSTVVLRRGSEHDHWRVRSMRRHKQFLLLTFDKCDSMSVAEQLIGSEVCVPERDLPPTGPGEIYHFQLIGMAVVTLAGEDVGMVTKVFDTASNTVCVVQGEDKEYLVPLVAAIVRAVDRDNRRLVIKPPPGLLGD